MIVDFSTHLITEKVAKELQKKPYYGPDERWEFRVPQKNADAKSRLELMDKYGIDVQVLSLTSGALMGFGPDEAAKVCKMSNDGIAEFCEKYPERFVGLAAVSLIDVDSALDELNRAVNNLGFKGVILATNQGGKGLDSPEYEVFFDKVSRFDVPILLHPTNWKSYSLVDDKMMTIFGWPFDTTQAVWRLIVGGVLDEFPTLKVVTHHLGAMLPYFSRRAISYAGTLRRKSLNDYWNQIYGDTAIDGAFESLLCAYAFFGSERMIFGTDYPFGADSGEALVRDNLESVKMMPVPVDVKSCIFYTNAKKLLKIR